MVTGASGFLGSWICRILAAEHNVFALVKNDSRLHNLYGIQNLEILRGDTANWPRLLKSISPSALILSHWWGVGNSYRDDFRQLENTSSFQALIDAAISSNIDNIIGIGSQAELGPISHSIDENQIDAPTTVYGEAKVAARKVLFSETKNTNTRSTWMRIFSTYGPLDYGTWLIPETIEALSLNKRMDLTLGEQRWSYLHAFDLGMAFLHIVNNPSVTGVINVGNPHLISIREVTQMIGNYFNRTDLLNYGAIPYKEDQVMHLQPKCETLGRLGWTPKIDISEGIIQTIRWNIGLESSMIDQNGTKIEIPGKLKTFF
jgi:nucleoside-diphosphate-sugar epimerase